MAYIAAIRTGKQECAERGIFPPADRQKGRQSFPVVEADVSRLAKVAMGDGITGGDRENFAAFRGSSKCIFICKKPEAIARARCEEPVLILMDLSLPVMSGWLAITYLKLNPITSRIPIIGLTAHAMVEGQEKAMSIGCDDYDTKPIEMPRLLQKIRHLLQPEVQRISIP